MSLKKVLLVHQDKIQHYRVPVYNYLHDYLARIGFELIVVSEGIQEGGDCPAKFPMETMRLGFLGLTALTRRVNPAAIILFINPGNVYLLPFILFARFTGKKTATWTHGIDLQSKHAVISRLLHHLEHSFCNGIILYAERLRPYLTKPHRKKAFVANNTLNLQRYDTRNIDRKETLKKYNITTSKNIICVGRIQKRKRIDDLFKAFERIDVPDVGLVLVGPDDEGLAASLAAQAKNVFLPGPLYGQAAIDLMRACDVYCIPGAIGLSIVDAQYCGLPVVTEDVDHGPEIMYLKNGINGFIVPKGDTQALAEKLRLLLTDNDLRKRFSEAAKEENATNGHIDRLCEGFVECLGRVVP